MDALTSWFVIFLFTALRRHPYLWQEWGLKLLSLKSQADCIHKPSYVVYYLDRSRWPVFVACFDIVGGPRHNPKSDTKTLRLEVISSDVARHLLINFHLYSRCSLHTSVHLAFNFGFEWVACVPLYWLISMFSCLCLHTSVLWCFVIC